MVVIQWMEEVDKDNKSIIKELGNKLLELIKINKVKVKIIQINVHSIYLLIISPKQLEKLNESNKHEKIKILILNQEKLISINRIPKSKIEEFKNDLKNYNDSNIEIKIIDQYFKYERINKFNTIFNSLLIYSNNFEILMKVSTKIAMGKLYPYDKPYTTRYFHPLYKDIPLEKKNLHKYMAKSKENFGESIINQIIKKENENKNYSNLKTYDNKSNEYIYVIHSFSELNNINDIHINTSDGVKKIQFSSWRNAKDQTKIIERREKERLYEKMKSTQQIDEKKEKIIINENKEIKKIIKKLMKYYK